MVSGQLGVRTGPLAVLPLVAMAPNSTLGPAQTPNPMKMELPVLAALPKTCHVTILIVALMVITSYYEAT